ncbi:MAG: glutamate-1-semialdehyde 2,1-aminomutase [bacterium]
MTNSKSNILFERARRSIPGGVNSPVRAFGSVGGTPRFIERGQGVHLYDADGNRYIDYVMSWGPLILGHAHPAVVEAVQKAASNGTSFGASTEAEIELAERVKERMPHCELLRLVSSGTEAVMTAARVARGFTGRDVIVKFDGCYHGHSDGFLVAAGSGLATGGLPASKGVPADITKNTLSLPYNDLETAAEAFTRQSSQIAAVIVEPIAANMGVVMPESGFLEGLRELTAKHGALLIFDEVITGFRVARGGATELLGVTPDLVMMGKIIGGGLPIGAVGGRREVMEMLAPVGDVYQAGTLSGNPISVAAGIATLKELDRPGFYDGIQNTTNKLVDELRKVYQNGSETVQINSAPGLLTVFFSTTSVSDFRSAKAQDSVKYGRFFHNMLNNGVYLPPSPYEAWFISSEHDDDTIAKTCQIVENSLDSMRL